MTLDRKLLSDARFWADQYLESSVAEKLRRQIEEYEIACKVASGPDPDRKKVWEAKQFDAHSDLEASVRMLSAKTEDAACVGKHENVDALCNTASHGGV